MIDRKTIYGVNLDNPITPIIARDALVKCFYEAHCADAGLETDDPNINMEYILDIVKKAITDAGGDFEKPTKESLLKTMDKLKDFAKNFRDESIIQKHSIEMIKILEKIIE